MGDYQEHEGSLIHRLANIAGDLEIGPGSRIDAFVTITGKVKLGKCVHLSTGACIFGSHGVVMGDYSGLSPGAKIFTATEDLSGEWLIHPTSPKHLRRSFSRSIHIGKHCTVGANSVLLPGAYLADGACVGALSLVKEPLDGWAIYAGIPAKRIKERCRKALQLEPA